MEKYDVCILGSHDNTKSVNIAIHHRKSDIKKIEKFSNMIKKINIDNKPIVQNMKSFLNNNKEYEIDNNKYCTMKDYALGNINDYLPEDTTRYIKKMIIDTDKIIPGFASDNNIVYAPSFELGVSKYKLSKSFETNIKGLYIDGDASGYFRGLMQAMISGKIISDDIKKMEVKSMKKNKNVKISDIAYSKDGVSRKYVQATVDNCRIETLYVNYKNKYIICFSTQVGCNLGCKFCYNGIRHNFKRNLTSDEICEQIENVINKEKPDNDKPILFSAMGIGEPLLNYDNLVKAFHILNKNYANSKFALATTGVNLKDILNLAEDLKDINKFKLTISLHSADKIKRNYLMPISSNLMQLVETVKKYKEISGREVEWNYVLFNNINDSIEDAQMLFELLGKEEYIKINKFNKVEISELSESKNKEIFISKLKDLGMQVEYYETNGVDIDGACGQMISE